jgi:hypothetical protein
MFHFNCDSMAFISRTSRLVSSNIRRHSCSDSGREPLTTGTAGTICPLPLRNTGLTCLPKELALFETAKRSDGDFAIVLGLRLGLLRVGTGPPDADGRTATLGREGLLTLEVSAVLPLAMATGTYLLEVSEMLTLPSTTGACCGEPLRRECGLGVGLTTVATKGLGVETPERGTVVLVTPDRIEPVVLGMFCREGLEVIRVDVVVPALARGLAEGRALCAEACLRLPVDAVLRFGSPAPGSDLAGSVDLAPTLGLDSTGDANGGL